MPSFDVVSEIDQHELTNAIDQAGRELSRRFDLKNTGARIEREGAVITLIAEAEFQARQLLDIVQNKLAGRGIDIDCLDIGEPSSNLAETRLPVTVREGIDKELARRLVKMVKDAGLKKVQAQVQQEQVRVTGKNRDDLQNVIALIKDAKLGYPLQFKNFRD